MAYSADKQNPPLPRLMTVISSLMSSTVSTSRGVLSPARLGTCDFPHAQASGPFGQSEPVFNDSEETELLRDLKCGEFGIVEMLFQCNILALVGGGANSQYPPNKVMIWDDHQNRCIGEFSFRSEVWAVKLRRDRIVVVLEHKKYVVTTYRGQVRIEHFGLKMTKFISAHDSHIACFTVTMDGLLLATASIKGTLIRIFNTMDGTCLQEEVAEIQSSGSVLLFLKFSRTSQVGAFPVSCDQNP
ncbi:hypothetical protein HHK36_014722 [Tetracentron sinense]|uniref:Uncharacterized protein n=1 Tax=Tetracentron sinense TaxID=13715 RepID=A0A834Z607_TETSI|nr:hypothetical protein HHK36_014722 [Tetracentron sinense]